MMHARCFVPASQWALSEVVLSPDESHHLLDVLRVRVGQQLGTFNGEGGEGTATVLAIRKGRVTLNMLQRSHRERPLLSLTLIQALTREPKMDLIVQKATELGAAAMIPVVTENGVVRLKSGPESEKKTERWERIAVAAAKQSGTLWLPRIEAVRPLSDFLSAHAPYDLFLACVLAEGARPIRDLMAEARDLKARSFGVLVGPEGDFSPDEVGAIMAAGAVAVSLGGNILRSETAALYALSILRYEFLA
jgi:16S rRNA (uracil1498-N3)-methyltransferase